MPVVFPALPFIRIGVIALHVVDGRDAVEATDGEYHVIDDLWKKKDSIIS